MVLFPMPASGIRGSRSSGLGSGVATLGEIRVTLQWEGIVLVCLLVFTKLKCRQVEILC